MKEEKKTDAYIPSPDVDKPKYFKPGGLVTAEHINELVDAIESLEKRVKELERSTR